MLMRDQIREFKILHAVVHFIVVFVMDVFVWSQLATKVLFHHETVKENSFAIDRDAPVTIWRGTARTLCAMASDGISMSLPSLVMRDAVAARHGGPRTTRDRADLTTEFAACLATTVMLVTIAVTVWRERATLFNTFIHADTLAEMARGCQWAV
jgi:hypothetical protein